MSSSTPSDIAYQKEALEGVARTFALTIAQLPGHLYEAVGNAYLLCRIADTIEDEPALSLGPKAGLLGSRFTEMVAGRDDPVAIRPRSGPAVVRLNQATRDANLVANTPRVIRRHAAPQPWRSASAILRCVRIMSRGMVEFQRKAST